MDGKLVVPREVRSSEVSSRSWRDLSMVDCMVPKDSGGEVVKRTKEGGKAVTGWEHGARRPRDDRVEVEGR